MQIPELATPFSRYLTQSLVQQVFKPDGRSSFDMTLFQGVWLLSACPPHELDILDPIVQSQLAARCTGPAYNVFPSCI